MFLSRFEKVDLLELSGQDDLGRGGRGRGEGGRVAVAI